MILNIILDKINKNNDNINIILNSNNTLKKNKDIHIINDDDIQDDDNQDDDIQDDDIQDDDIQDDEEYEYNEDEDEDDSLEYIDDNKIDDESLDGILNNTVISKKRKDKPFNKTDEDILENKKKQQKKYSDIIKLYNKDEKNYFNSLSVDKQLIIYNNEKDLQNINSNVKEPLRFKFLNLNIPLNIKNLIISKITQLNKMFPCSGEYFKLYNWVDTLSKIPLCKYHSLPITNDDKHISIFLQNIKSVIDKNIFGHEETKQQIIKILAQWITNPNSNGHIIGIQGSPGIGKTKLVKDGICKAMNYPFSFISLGGIGDASYLNGHNYTFEGATYGKIIECLIKTQVMNPVILFDELDKISQTPKGDEIINTLIHLTDPVQNEKFTDKYFEEIELDLSKSLIIFTYNNENDINPILKDRMITIRVSGYNSKEKLIISRDYIVPEILHQFNLSINDINFEENLLKIIIDEDTSNEGMRDIKRIISDVISTINMMKYIPVNNLIINYPFTVNTEFYNKYCKKEKKYDIKKDILHSLYL